MMKEQDELMKAIKLFSKLTGVTPGQKSFSLNMSGSFNTYDAGKAFEEIKKFMELDPTLATSAIVLREVYEKYMRDSSYGLRDLVAHAKKGDLIMQFSRNVQLDNLIYRSSLSDLHESTVKRVKKVLKHYGRNTKDSELIKRVDWLKDMLINAASAHKQLDIRQYHRGADDPSKPAMVEAIVEFKSIEEAIRYGANIPGNFMMVGYIPDRVNELWSYFFFMIKRGENIYTASDAVSFIHPQQKEMFNSRRGGIRAFESKKAACYEYFPYELIVGFEEREVEDFVKLRESKQKALAATNDKSRIRAQFSGIREASLVWMNLVADKLHSMMFAEETFDVPQLTGFTSEAPALPEVSTALVPSTGGAVVQWDAMRIDLPVLQKEEMAKKEINDMYEGRNKGIHQRLEDYYFDTLGMDVLLPSEKYLRPQGESTRWKDPNEWKGGLTLWQADCCNGTEEELLVARKQVARLNARQAVSALALTDYREQVVDACKQVVALINKTPALLFDYLISNREQAALYRARSTYFEGNREEFSRTFAHDDIERVYIYAEGHKTWYDCKPTRRYASDEIREMADVPKGQIVSIKGSCCYDKDGTIGSGHEGYIGSIMLKCYDNRDHYSGQYSCPFMDTRSTRHYLAWFRCIKDLQLMGYDTSGLPEIMQRLWHPKDTRYVGNSILSNIDPMDTREDLNPWSDLKLRVQFSCSARAQKAIEAGKIVTFPGKFELVSRDRSRNPYCMPNMPGAFE